MDKVSSARPAAHNWSNSERAWRCTASAVAKSGAGSGIVIRPLSTRFGNCATSRASARASDGATPDLVGPPSMFTCRQTCKGARCAGRCSDRRCAIFSRSTVCAHSKCPATSRVLFDWIGPMQCQTSGRSASAAILSTASWM